MRRAIIYVFVVDVFVFCGQGVIPRSRTPGWMCACLMCVARVPACVGVWYVCQLCKNSDG